MAIQVYYDASNADGGSPPWASHKDYDRLADNLTVSSAEVEDDSDNDEWETPCVENNVQGYVLVSGPYDYYDVIVTMAGISQGIGAKTGTGKVTGGLGWHFNDDKDNTIQKGMYLVGQNIGGAPPVPVNSSYTMRLQNNKRTKVCSCSIAGGIQLAPNPNGNLYVSTRAITTMSWSIQFLFGWSFINISINGGNVTVPVPFDVGGNISSGPLSYSELVSNNVGSLLAGFRTMGGQQINAELVKMDEDFQDPELKRQIGEAASVMENPDIKQKLDRAIERQSKSGAHKKSGG